MKKLFNGIFYLLISMILITVIAVLFLLNSTKTIEWAADKYAPQYGFGYKSISGGLLTGLEVEDLTFKGDKLLDRLKIRWNPAPLLRSRVSVTHLEATALDVESIKRVVSAFSSDKEDNSTSVLPVSIGVRKLHITVNPFEQSGIEIRAVSLGGKDIVYSSDGVDIDDFLLAVDTNISSLRLGGGANDGKVEISKISLLDIDTVSLRQIADGFAPEGSIEQNQTEPKEISLQNESAKNELLKNPLIPHTLSIDRVEVSVKPAEYPQFMLNRGELNATAIMVDIGWVLERKPEAIGVGGIQLLVDTNLTQLSLDGDLEKDIVTINSLSIRDIDTLALKELFASDETVKREPVESEAPKESMPTDSDANPLIPKYLIVKHLDSSILSATYDPLLVKSAEVNATDIKFDIQKLVADSGEVDIYVASSFANLIQHGVIKSNQIESRGHITPLKLLFETYKIPLREDALGHIVLDINANREKAEVDIVIDGKDILQADDGGFNLNTLHLANHITYLVSKSSLTVKSEGDITTPYTKNLKLDNLLTFEDGVLGYRGEVDPGPLEGIDGNYTKPLDDLKITYRGDEKSIEALIDSEGVIGKFVSLDFKKGEFDLATKTPLVLKNMVSLPEKLQEAQASLDIHLPLDFNKITPLKAKAKISSNMANIDADILYDKEIKVLTKTIFPKDSLLRGFSKELNLDALSPLEADVTMIEKVLHVDVKSTGITSKVKFDMESQDLDGDLIVGGAKFIFDGNLDKNVTLDNQVSSLQTLLKKIHTIYAFEMPPLDGDMKVTIVLQNKKDISLNLYSNELIYKADRTTDHILNDTMISLGFSDGVLKLNRYHTTFQKQKIFATKPSLISFKDGSIEISPLWVNDQLKVTGRYIIEEKKGEVLAFADTFTLSHELIDLQSHIDIKTKLDGPKTAVNGTVTILGGDIHYNIETKSFASDSDILIVQNMKKSGSSPFMDNLSVMIKVNTKKHLLYKTDEANIRAKADMHIQKAPKGPIYVLGTAEVLKGSNYTFKNKKFVFKKSIVAFTGDPKKPILDIVAIYNSINYEIKIQVTGDPTAPNIVLSSIPSLTREQILSVILFDSEDGSGSNSGDEMMKMMGGAMAKSVLNNVGIKIDHLSLGADGSMEIGKKISDKVTIIYVNDEVAGAILQYDYSRDIKAVISTDSESSAAGIIYKREFKNFGELKEFR